MDCVAAGLMRIARKDGKPAAAIRAETCLVGGQKLQRIELDLRDAQDRPLEVHVYEGYWAPVTEGQVKITDVISFLLRGGFNGMRNAWKDFHRWMFGGAVNFGKQPRTGVFLTLACCGDQPDRGELPGHRDVRRPARRAPEGRPGRRRRHLRRPDIHRAHHAGRRLGDLQRRHRRAAVARAPGAGPGVDAAARRAAVGLGGLHHRARRGPAARAARLARREGVRLPGLQHLFGAGVGGAARAVGPAARGDDPVPRRRRRLHLHPHPRPLPGDPHQDQGPRRQGGEGDLRQR